MRKCYFLKLHLSEILLDIIFELEVIPIVHNPLSLLILLLDVKVHIDISLIELLLLRLHTTTHASCCSRTALRAVPLLEKRLLGSCATPGCLNGLPYLVIHG